MKERLKVVILFFALLMCFSCSAEDYSRWEKLRDDSIGLIAAIASEAGVPGVAVYIKSSRDGEFSLAWGVADLENEIPVSELQPFRIGSLSKSFTALAVLKLTEAGLVDLDLPITDYLGVVNDYAPLMQISVRQLMNMSSGLAPCLSKTFLINNVLADPLREYTPEELLAEAFTSMPGLLFVPGTEFLYVNTNYILLGMLIEEVSGQSYQDYVNEKIIIPLGLVSTFVVTDANIPEGLARGYYDSNEDGHYEDWTEVNMSYVWSAGCIVSNARDVAIYMDALAKGELISEKFHPDLFGGQPTGEGSVYGAGILVADKFGVGHNGTVIGYHADAWYDPESGTTVAVLSNTNSPILDDEGDPTKEIAAGILRLFK